MQTRLNSIAAGLILGFVWGAFHWVALLQNPQMPSAYLGVGSLNLMAFSVVMTFVFNKTRGNVLVLALAHARYNTISMAVVPLLAFALGICVAWLVVIPLVIGNGVELGRNHHQAVQSILDI